MKVKPTKLNPKNLLQNEQQNVYKMYKYTENMYNYTLDKNFMNTLATVEIESGKMSEERRQYIYSLCKDYTCDVAVKMIIERHRG